jgi:hypothetical protein
MRAIGDLSAQKTVYRLAHHFSDYRYRISDSFQGVRNYESESSHRADHSFSGTFYWLRYQYGKRREEESAILRYIGATVLRVY